MRSTYRKERRMKRRERRSALRRGNKRRMWHDNKPDSLSSPSSPSTQSGFEVRFYLVPPNVAFTDPVLCNSLRHHTRSQLETLTDPLSHVWTGERKKQQEQQSLHWPFPPLTILQTSSTKMTRAWLSYPGISLPDRRKHKRSVFVCSHPPPLPSHMLTHLHSSPLTLSHESFDE